MALSGAGELELRILFCRYLRQGFDVCEIIDDIDSARFSSNIKSFFSVHEAKTSAKQ